MLRQSDGSSKHASVPFIRNYFATDAAVDVNAAAWHRVALTRLQSDPVMINRTTVVDAYNRLLALLVKPRFGSICASCWGVWPS